MTTTSATSGTALDQRSPGVAARITPLALLVLLALKRRRPPPLEAR